MSSAVNTALIAAGLIVGWWILWLWIRRASGLLRRRQVLLLGLLGTLVIFVLAVNWQRRHPGNEFETTLVYVEPFAADSRDTTGAALARYTIRLALEAADPGLISDAAHSPHYEPWRAPKKSGIPAAAIREGAHWLITGALIHDGEKRLALTLTRLDREGGPVHHENFTVAAQEPVELGLNTIRELLSTMRQSTPCEVCLDPFRPAAVSALAWEESASTPEAALKRINRSLRTLSDEASPLLLVRKAERLMEMRREEEAGSVATQALGRLGANAAAFDVLARLEAIRGNMDEAVRLWRRAVSEDPHAVDPLLSLAAVPKTVRERTGLEPPELLLQRGLSARPANVELRLRLAGIWETRIGGRRRALDLIHEGLRVTGGNLRLRLRESSLLIALGRYNEAERSVHRVLAADSTDGNAWYNLALTLRSLGQVSAAQSAVKKSFVNGGPADLHYLQGLLYETQGDTAAARESYRLRWSLRDLTGEDPVAEAARQRLRSLR